jgi:tetratricopeptide (TPR) repeat protein
MRLLRAGAAGLVLALVAPGAQAAPAPAQDLPSIPIETYPPVSRGPISTALAAARTAANDPARVGQLAMTLHAWEQFDTAAAVYARARALERRFDWYYLGGLVENRAARYAEAAALLSEAVTLAPGHLAARLALADARFEAGEIDAAARDYSDLRSGASAPHAHYGLGRCLAAKGDSAAALVEFDRALQLFPEFGPAHYARGMALRRLGRTADARAALARSQSLGQAWPAVADPVLARVRALRDDPDRHIDKGLLLQQQADIGGAIAEYGAALAIDPQSMPAHVNLIALYGRQQQWDKAESHYRALKSLGNVPAEAHYNFGICLAAQQRHAEAAETFRKALAANPHHAGALTALGQLAEVEGRVGEAEASYRQALAESPGDPAIRFNVGRMLIARREYNAAVDELGPLRSIDHPDRPRFLFGLATANVLAGNLEEGRRLSIEARDLARERGQRELADAIDRELAKLQ